jgi:hypothetical protein
MEKRQGRGSIGTQTGGRMRSNMGEGREEGDRDLCPTPSFTEIAAPVSEGQSL